MNPLKPEVLQKDPLPETMAKLFGNIDLNLPELKPNANIISIIFHRVEMKQRAEISTHKATIAANNAIAMKANIELMGMMMNLPLLLEESRNRIEHQRMLDEIMRTREITINQTMQIEAKDRATELEQKMKELGIGTPKA